MLESSFLEFIPKPHEIFANPQMKSELIQIIIQTLSDFGYAKSAEMLRQESNISSGTDHLQDLQSLVTKGDFSSVLAVFEKIEIEPEKKEKAHFLINEQIYLEMLAAKNTQGALSLLRQTLSKFTQDSKRVHKLASLIICKDFEQLSQSLGYNFSIEESRKNLISEIHDQCQIPKLVVSKRMAILLHQAFCFQAINSQYYTPGMKVELNLLNDLACDEGPLPTKPIQTLHEHKDEVWIVKFSHDGNHLASVGKSCDLLLWNFDNKTFSASLKFKKEKIHDKEVNSLYWSPDNKKILTASSDFKIKLWSAETGELKLSIIKHTDIVCSAIWLPDGEHFVSGGIDNLIIMWNTRGDQIFQLKSTSRITDLMISKNGRMLLSVNASASKINVIDITRNNESRLIQERDLIISACCSNDSKYLLVNTSHKYPELHLWSLESFKLLKRYAGHVQEKYVIRCCFGGINDGFLACGGEDGIVRIWHKNSPDHLKALNGHTMPVNSVDWSQRDHRILATASDDNTVKIWVSEDIFSKNSEMIDMEEEEDENEDIVAEDMMLEESNIMQEIDEASS